MAQRVAAMDVRMAAALVGAVPDVTAFCAGQGISRQTFYKWRRRIGEDGVAGLAERSRRPHTSPGATPPGVEDAIVRLRKQLADAGEDCGPDPIRWRLLAAAHTAPDPVAAAAQVPSRSTVAQILRRRGLIIPAPSKRPKSSMHRFTYARPNECWQSDWTGWRLADGTPVAIAGTLDDHSRYLCALRAGIGDADTGLVWATATAAIAECGVPAMSLTDNGLVYSGRRRGFVAAFEANLRALGVSTITSTPFHPQTCGKIERFWQTLKKWLPAHDPTATVAELQALLDQFRDYYNQLRPHRALRGATPQAMFTAGVKARPAAAPIPAPVIVTDAVVADTGAVGVGGYWIHVGTRWAGHHVTGIRDGDRITILSGPRLVRALTADPTRRYQPADDDRGHRHRGHREPHPR
jgi:transposase InsO family protein